MHTATRRLVSPIVVVVGLATAHCGGSDVPRDDANVDGAHDGAHDATSDASVDAVDAARDATDDVPVFDDSADTAFDATTDVIIDAASDTAHDVASDTGTGSSGPILGVFEHGYGDNVDAFGAWLGRPALYADTFSTNNDWSGIEVPSWITSNWGPWVAASPGRRLVLAIPMLPTSGGTLAQGATGAFDAHWRTAAQHLVAAGLGHAVLRIGHELNGSWYIWSASPFCNGCSTRPAEYAAYWRHIVDAMRAVPGADFDFNWNVSYGVMSSGGVVFDPADAYPGDAYVGSIGLDIYDSSWGDYPTSGTITTAMRDAAWNNFLHGRGGLEYWRDFAAAHGKPLTLPEWGLWEVGSHHGGGDDAAFIQRMHDWMADPANRVAWQCYFDVVASDGDHQLQPTTQFPIGAARYRSVFSR